MTETAIEIRKDADGTDGLIDAITTKFDGEDVPLRGEEWRAVADTPYSLVLTQWADSAERDIPTGPKVRVTFTVHVERAQTASTSKTQTQTSLNALAAAVDCDTAETVRWEIAETLDKCAGTEERLLEQIRAGEDCATCPPGFLAVVMQAEKLARALGVALDLLGVPAIDPGEAEGHDADD